MLLLTFLSKSDTYLTTLSRICINIYFQRYQTIFSLARLANRKPQWFFCFITLLPQAGVTGAPKVDLACSYGTRRWTQILMVLQQEPKLLRNLPRTSTLKAKNPDMSRQWEPEIVTEHSRRRKSNRTNCDRTREHFLPPILAVNVIHCCFQQTWDTKNR